MQDRTKGFKKRGNPEWSKGKFASHANDAAKVDAFNFFDSK